MEQPFRQTLFAVVYDTNKDGVFVSYTGKNAFIPKTMLPLYNHVYDFSSEGDTLLLAKSIDEDGDTHMSIETQNQSNSHRLTYFQQFGTLYTQATPASFPDNDEIELYLLPQDDSLASFLDLAYQPKALLTRAEFDWDPDAFNRIELKDRFEVKITGYNFEKKILLCSRKATLPKPFKQIKELFSTPRNVLFIGSTGAGKSSLINSILKFAQVPNAQLAKVGYIDPETKIIRKYPCHNLTLWDSPGVGESQSRDRLHQLLIEAWLTQHSHSNDKIVVVLDANSRDYGSVFSLLKVLPTSAFKDCLLCVNRIDTIFPNGILESSLGDGEINDSAIEQKISDKLRSVQTRVFQATLVEGRPVATMAETGDDFGKSSTYHLERLLQLINQ